ncbi:MULTISPECIES: RDD family protein [unclassified Microbacterium]|uniref:RDD family protein n=1 Tax=unclassified Microbacterium TaxID=2609290 RepID=UPI00214CF5EA|nr:MULTISPECIES: RDD family protein [unclassified Microbacterium]MCR2785238.1 RDD family protein [Microbacterium sp. zg.B96]WIM16770.1 RDD family protein [Microbacterium sp. zg-B96]
MPTPGPAVEIRQDEILTGEAVALDVQPIGYFLRAVGVLIDMVAGVLLFVLLALVVSWATWENVLGGELTGVFTIVVMVMVMVVIPTAVETATRGRSLGKLAIGARIVRVDGGASGFRQALIRALVGVFELWFTAGAVAGIVGAFTPRSERLGDLLAGTYSERTRTPKLPPAPPGVPAALTGWATIADVGRLPDRLARRIAQFVRQAGDLDPAARIRTAMRLADEAREFVSPVPPVDPETLLLGVVAVRRERELRALQGEDERTAALTAGVGVAPRGFPER